MEESDEANNYETPEHSTISDAEESIQNRPNKKKLKRKFDSAGFRQRQQLIAAAQLNLSDVLGATPEAKIDPSFKVVTIKDDIAQGAKYVFQGDGLRRVPPYYFTYLTYCKARWRDKNIFEVFSKEFRDKEPDYYRQKIQEGQVTLNGHRVGLDATIRNGDLISHRSHKHEPAVPDRPIEIIFQNEEIVVIDKPSGVPVHPVGRYRYNTVTEIMKHEMNLIAHPAHRLDRLTSGVLILARTGKAASQYSQRIRDRSVYKEYLARVLGEFPTDEVVCDLPVITVDPRLGLNMVKTEGKPATTIFNRISFNGQSSVVRCRPLTGRTHQIRIHLQYLGHPIQNDPIYANRRVFGPHLGKGGDYDENDVRWKLHKMGREEVSVSAAYEEIEAQYLQSRGEKLLGQVCPLCESPLFSDARPYELEIWLHALKYGSKEENWEYETRIPDWAKENFVL
ncbi:pseudouridine synthase [Lipomyces oligophaga]|uniref:pseudouridine synthase n=1 Tax=Lipomyces oligophaga TaxID=45792 RepID=UPI0034CD80C9